MAGTPRAREAVTVVVPGERLELSHCCQYRILNPARLPIPPSRHEIDRLSSVREAAVSLTQDAAARHRSLQARCEFRISTLKAIRSAGSVP